MDIKNFYLNTLMARKEYLRLTLYNKASDAIEEYGLQDKATADGYVYVAVSKGMYGLPQTGIIAQQLLEERLGEEGYFQSKFTSGLWSHEWRLALQLMILELNTTTKSMPSNWWKGEILWTRLGMGLHQKRSPPLHAGVH